MSTTRFGAKYCMRCGKWTDHQANHCPLPNPKHLHETPPAKETVPLGWPFPKRHVY